MLAILLRKPRLHLDVLPDGILALLQVSTPSVSLSAFDYTWFPDLSFRFVDNYMDYTDDACYEEFTAGQITRLKQQLATYRGI